MSDGAGGTERSGRTETGTPGSPGCPSTCTAASLTPAAAAPSPAAVAAAAAPPPSPPSTSLSCARLPSKADADPPPFSFLPPLRARLLDWATLFFMLLFQSGERPPKCHPVRHGHLECQQPFVFRYRRRGSRRQLDDEDGSEVCDSAFPTDPPDEEALDFRLATPPGAGATLDLLTHCVGGDGGYGKATAQRSTQVTTI